MEQSWMSYDPVAVIYHRLAAPHLFSPIAQNLVALLELPDGGRILDVGTGTGVGGRSPP